VRGEAKWEEPLKAGHPAPLTYYASIRRSSPDFLVRHSFPVHHSFSGGGSDGGIIHYSKFTILLIACLLWCPKGPNRKKALLPNEAKLFTPNWLSTFLKSTTCNLAASAWLSKIRAYNYTI
jgi:hypothetical protein